MEFIRAVENIKALPPELHWFCPRDGPTDQKLYLPEDVEDRPAKSNGEAVSRSQRSKDAISRKLQVLDALKIFAFDGEEAQPYQQWIEKRLAKQMAQCDICSREFHRGRRELEHKLKEDYENDQVQAFMQRFDRINTKRITQGLASAESDLKEAPPEQRGLKTVDGPSLYALFEVLNCTPFLQNEKLLSKHFDIPFRLIQENRRLKLSSYTPAMAYFIFHEQQDRYTWAHQCWEKMKRNITPKEFEWSIREPLWRSMMRVTMQYLERDFTATFWAGTKRIVEKLDAHLITHGLRAMEIDICKLALDNLQIDSDGFPDLLQCVERIIRIAPADFWDAMGSTPASVWVDQFFNSPAFARILEAKRVKETDLEDSEPLFSWMIPFVASINPVNQVPACRGFVNQLLGKYQDEQWSANVRRKCCIIGLDVLSTTLISLSSQKPSSGSRTATSDLLDLVGSHVTLLSSLAKTSSPLADVTSQVIGRAFALECQYLLADRDALAADRPHHEGSCQIHTKTWEQAAKALTNGNILFARHLIQGSKNFVGVEKFVIRKSDTTSARLEQFNEAFDKLHELIASILERMAEYDPAEIQKMFDDADSANAFVSLLFSSSGDVRSAVIETVKAVSGQTIRREAIGDALSSYFPELLNAYSMALRTISYKRTFAPAPYMLALLKDTLDVLCNSQNGLLRISALSDAGIKAAEGFWQALWQELGTIFAATEDWANMGHEKTKMMEFCGNVMEFANNLFDQFPVFATALNSTTEGGTKPQSAGKQLLERPRTTVGVMVKFLRLRDDFLLRQSTALICDVLKRLKQFDTHVDEGTLLALGDMITGKTRTMLTPNQKAELHRALERHLGKRFEIEGPSTNASKKLKTGVIDLEKWQATAKTGSTPASDLDALIKSNSSSVEVFKTQQLSQAAGRLSSMPGSNRNRTNETKVVDVAEFGRKRREEMEAKRKRDVEAAARLRRNLHPNGVEAMTLQQGSALKGLGVSGKDHSAPKGTGMMVSSSESESDDSDSDLDKELFGGIKKAPKTPEAVKALEEEKARRRERLKQQGPVKKQRLVRSAKDMRARLAPDLAPLHKNILSWEYNHNGPFPPNASPKDYATVLSTFRDPVDYQRTFEPLLTLEAWNGFLKAKEENMTRPYELKVITRSSVDAFLEVSSTMDHKDAKEVSEGDVVLLFKGASGSYSESDHHCLSRVNRIMRKKAHIEVLYRILPGTSMVQSLSPNALVRGLKIMPIVPLEREYGALLGLQYYDLCDEIAKARPSPLLSYSDERLQPFIRNYNVNKAQAKAIRSALDNDAFTLVQGPPGSGKTKTIVAIVGALLTDNLRHGTVPVGHLRPDVGNARPATKKMLVCAPSNAAVDELVMRFKEGVKITTGDHKAINVVRLGRSDNINQNVLDVTLDELVNKRLGVNCESSAREATQKLMLQHQQISHKLNDARAKLDAEDNKENRQNMDEFRKSKALLSQKIDNAKDNEGAQTRRAELNRRKAQQNVIEDAHVICATLSGSGHDMFQNLNVEFETVIIDEAAQCVELSALIPLKYGCAKCILVGDPQQLPPTVFSKDAARFKYEQSLFVRMQSNHPNAVHLLDTQYRMHPAISAFPSKAFYNSRLLDGPNMAKLRARPWHAAELLGPYQFFDVKGLHEAAPRGHSLVNHAEVRTAMQLYYRLTTDFKQDFNGRVGIITPYKSQLRLLKEQFKAQFGNYITDDIEFNTTDAFQGRESEIIIFSCVRASPGGTIGFLNDIRRMNVGLTRAKSSLWVLGNSESLMRGEYWAKLVQHSQDTGCLFKGNIEAALKEPSRQVMKIEDGLDDAMEIDDENGPPMRRPRSSVTSSQAAASMVSSSTINGNVKRFVTNSRLPATNEGSEPAAEQKSVTGPSRASKPVAPKRELAEENTKPLEKSSSTPSSSEADIEMADIIPLKKKKRKDTGSARASPAPGLAAQAAVGPTGVKKSLPPAPPRKQKTNIFLNKKKPRG